MNYTREMLLPKELKKWPGAAKQLLVWNDDNPLQPRKMLVTGMQIGDKPWLVPLNFGDGAEEYGFQHAAEIPKDWTPYKEPEEIPIFDAEVGKQYRVVGTSGMPFDRVMYCVRFKCAGHPLFGETPDSEKLIGDDLVQHLFTC